LGSWQVCHNVCLGIIALLAAIGITIVGMPLGFLTKITIPLWIIAVLLLGVTIWFYVKRKCISKNLIVLNSGLIIAGVPFKTLEKFTVFFWVVGGIFVLAGISLYVSDRINQRGKR